MTTQQQQRNLDDIRNQAAEAFEGCRQLLLSERPAAGHWEGELSTSALSTATAVMALHQVRQHNLMPEEHESLVGLICGGLKWLRANRNSDGGWGDTMLSISNISTTMLARAVFSATMGNPVYGSAAAVPPEFLALTDDWILRQGGVPAVRARYGKDRTFSVPILMQCALGDLVDWSEVDPLPFELACLPAEWYKWAQLPVVSYALPALIAIGVARHRKRPTRMLPWRWLRRLATPAALRVLKRIQPTTGGYLEATPLTSFVTMALVSAGEGQQPVVPEAVRFLRNSVRADGSWPIDTNLATWVTTLSVNALGDTFPETELEPVLNWLLGQQYRETHPYTNADPGGWAWTDLPGGVPDADDTPGAILALLHWHGRVAGTRQTEIADATTRAVQWLLDLQNRDAGWPTFCRGWGKLPFDRSSQDITAHAVRAIRAFVEVIGPEATLRARCQQAITRGMNYLKQQQRPDGAWLPLWFGNQAALADENPTYGTARVLLAFPSQDSTGVESPQQRGLRFLESIQNPDGGWGGAAGCPSSVEETGLALEALCHTGGSHTAVAGGVAWLHQQWKQQQIAHPAPIGFYFAKLWYYEKLYPLIFATSALRQVATWKPAP